ncbi:cytochrome P450, partial [Trifolium medium]|nr:cytochrome P450 [Trifolium medium]
MRRRRGGDGVNRSCDMSRQAFSEESTSSGSINNDWKHWVVMQGNDQMVVDDVWGIRKVIGVKFKGDNVNMFRVLSRAGKGKQVVSRQEQGELGRRKGARGLGGLEKRKEVRKLVGDQNPLLLCIQETKLQSCEDFLCSTLWGNSPHVFSYRPSIGASGGWGLLTFWNSSEVEVWSTESREHVLWCHGRFIKSGEEFSVANVYAPCDYGAKIGLWDSLSVRIQSLGRRMVCICGDFNAVKNLDERRSSRG